MLDLEPIKVRLLAFQGEPNRQAHWNFTTHAPSDIADLVAEVERLREEAQGFRTFVGVARDRGEA